jgi:inward rectifier potassium channel
MAFSRNKQAEPRETGFGSKVYESNQRLMNKDGSSNVRRRGLPFFEELSFFHSLINMSWGRFNMLVLFTYLIANLFFAVVYYLIGFNELGGMVGTSKADQFWEAFFFSAQSLTTVGYGRLNPIGFHASVVAAIESMTGLLGFALATGLLYGRFSKPYAKILFTKNAIIAPYQDKTALMMRIANKRKNELIDVEAAMTMAWVEKKDGKEVREFDTLTLEYKHINFLSMTWTIVHPIDKDSPLFGMNQKDLAEKRVEFLLMIKAFDETFSQTIQARSSYKYDETIYGARFKPITDPGPDGSVIVSLNRLNDMELVELISPSAHHLIN